MTKTSSLFKATNNFFSFAVKMKFLGCLSAASLAALLAVPSCHSFQATSRWGSVARRHENSIQSIRLGSTVSAKKPGTAELDTPWEELGFEFRPTNSHVKVTYKDGEWGKPELVEVGISILWRFFLPDLFSHLLSLFA